MRCYAVGINGRQGRIGYLTGCVRSALSFLACLGRGGV
jgi:hypothetical protein